MSDDVGFVGTTATATMGRCDELGMNVGRPWVASILVCTYLGLLAGCNVPSVGLMYGCTHCQFECVSSMMSWCAT